MDRNFTLRKLSVAFFLVVILLMGTENKVSAQCSGTPVGGTAVISSSGLGCNCPLFTVTGSSYAPNIPGLSLSWQVNNANTGGAWVNAPGTSGATFFSPVSDSTIVCTIPISTQFRRMITCNNSGLHDFSSVITFDPAVACNSPFYIFISSVNPNCNNNGTLTSNNYGGTAPFSYLWSDGQTTQTAIGLGAGIYTVTVTDDSGLIAGGFHNLFFSCNNVLEGTVFIDINGNCLLDSGETGFQGAYVMVSNGSQNYYDSPDSNGNYSINIPISGTFQISAYIGGYGSCGSLTVCSGNSVTFPSVGDTSIGNNIGFTGSTDFDLNDHPGDASSNPGFTKEYWSMPFNSAIAPFNGTATVTFNYDPNLIYLYSLGPVLPVHDSINHTLTWSASNIPSPSYDWYNYRLRNFFHVPASLPINYLLQSDFYIAPTSGDCDTNNNHHHFSELVTASHDPNEKTVTPAGDITNADSVLTYTIHFQNTGTDTTHFVIVKDTLSQYLNPASVVNLASSAPYSDFNISGTGILTWVFNPLFLPDSASNEAASKGFVMFKIKVKPNLAAGTTINNKASIYFDYNSPVVTNTATNSVFSGVKELANNNLQLAVYPNPAGDELTVTVVRKSQHDRYTLSITDIFGKELLHKTSIINSEILNLKSFSSGIYFLKVTGADGTVLVKKFVKE